jgi:anti-sigma regulatory factor (Ser/Thr protein kinase)
MSRKGKEVIPGARRLVGSLRNLGYDFTTAVADIVDNSIEAKASKVDIGVHFDGEESWVRIADNGFGMKPPEIAEALRYGAEREYTAEDLGKFGLGLKTASLSQCQRVSVASRTSAQRAVIAAYEWDIEHIRATNRWEILELDDARGLELVRSPLADGPGTVVLWRRLDRVLDSANPDSGFAKRRVLHMCRDLELHLAMVFHRFLAGEERGRRLTITLNGNVVKPWDPFARSERHTRPLQAMRVPVEAHGVSGELLIEPFVLPSQHNFSTPEAHAASAGPRKWNQQQGFYIYRAGRLIQSGGWNRLRTADEHTKLARVAIRFAPALDEAFEVNVAKMTVRLPLSARTDIERALAPVLKLAQEAYRSPGPSSSSARAGTTTKAASTANPGGHGSVAVQAAASRPAAQQKKDGASVSPDPVEWTLGELRSCAKDDELPVLNAVIARFKRQQRV